MKVFTFLSVGFISRQEAQKLKSLKNRLKVALSVKWAFVESFLSAAFTLATTLTAARFISPEQFGLAAVAFAASTIIQAVFLTGITNTIVRAPSLDTHQSDAFFGLTLALGGAACLLNCFLAIPLAKIYGSSDLIALLMVQSLTSILMGVVSVPSAILARKMRTKALAMRTLGQKIVTLVFTASLAWYGAGAWAIIVGSLTGTACGAAVLILSLSRTPRASTAWRDCLPVLRLARSVTLELIAGMISPRLVMLLFGWFHGLEAAGCLNFAVRLIDELSNILKMVVARTALPLFSMLQRHGDDTLQAFEKGARLICLISSPILLGIAAIAPDLVTVVFGSHWMPAVYAVQVVAITWALAFTRVLIGPFLLAKGIQSPQTVNSWIALFLGIMGGVLSAPIILPHASWAYAVPVLGSIPTGIYLTKKLAGVSVRNQVRSVIGPLLAAGAMAVAIALTREQYLAELNQWTSLAIQVSLGIMIYVMYTLLFNYALMRDAAAMLRPRR